MILYYMIAYDIDFATDYDYVYILIPKIVGEYYDDMMIPHKNRGCCYDIDTQQGQIIIMIIYTCKDGG